MSHSASVPIISSTKLSANVIHANRQMKLTAKVASDISSKVLANFVKEAWTRNTAGIIVPSSTSMPTWEHVQDVP